ncbi:MAG TPA: DUF2282 domain-containing protein [Acidiferrobacterales bacterium]|jgi:uncharacterized membrane protein
MKQTHALILSAIGGVLALGIASGAAAAEKNVEKCYGVVKAGKNDCQTATSACAGTATKDGRKEAWIYLPKGSCDKIVGGSLKPGKG